MTESQNATIPDALHNTQKGMAGLTPVSTFEVHALSRVKSVEFVCESTAITALVHLEDGKTVRYQCLGRATVKRGEAVMDLDDQYHVTIYTY